MKNISFANRAYIEEVYEHYLQDPASLDHSWIAFFQELEITSSLSLPPSIPLNQEERIKSLQTAYQNFGYLKCPVYFMKNRLADTVLPLSLPSLNISLEELNTPFKKEGTEKNDQTISWKEIIDQLETIYCGSIGTQLHASCDPQLKEFIHQELCKRRSDGYSISEKKMILQELDQVEVFENFLQKKFTGQKRFSLEGAQTLIPMLKNCLEEMVNLGIKEVEMGMAHRGRVAVLAQFLQKPYDLIFQEFKDDFLEKEGSFPGDVKYHLGWKNTFYIQGHGIQLLLSPNPSHLEAVIPVVEGRAKGRQEHRDPQSVLPLLIHGDAALSGQGIVYETLQLSQLKGYETGGTVHIVINNHVGFTASSKEEKSTQLCTDIATAFHAPVFHVNAEDVEACLDVMKLSLKIRQQFHCDVFIDLNCYRKYGHNESDEPAFTHPLEYQEIKKKQEISTIYHASFQESLSLEIGNSRKEFISHLETCLTQTSHYEEQQEEKIKAPFISLVTLQELQSLITAVSVIPEGFTLHPKLKKRSEEKQQVKHHPQELLVDWALGEELAYAALLSRQVSVRLSGQDSCRGTFSHRHAVWVDQLEGSSYRPLSQVAIPLSSFQVYNSILSEYGVLGFELGYALTAPRSLVIWEAQFGDFVNGAQIVIDQFLSSMEKKWKLSCNLTLFLPHGYEGQGSEHSSALLERFLQLSADDNWRVVQCTTPKQLFHLLYDQGIGDVKKPLILMTPKSLLRHPLCKSSLEELAQGSFEKVLVSPAPLPPLKIILCTGKIYYDLLEQQSTTTVLIRLEQLYPFPLEELLALIQEYQQVQTWVWVQEEPKNRGAWSYVKPLLDPWMKTPLRYVGRKEGSVVASGSHNIHQQQQFDLIQEAVK